MDRGDAGNYSSSCQRIKATGFSHISRSSPPLLRKPEKVQTVGERSRTILFRGILRSPVRRRHFPSNALRSMFLVLATPNGEVECDPQPSLSGGASPAISIAHPFMIVASEPIGNILSLSRGCPKYSTHRSIHSKRACIFSPYSPAPAAS